MDVRKSQLALKGYIYMMGLDGVGRIYHAAPHDQLFFISLAKIAFKYLDSLLRFPLKKTPTDFRHLAFTETLLRNFPNLPPVQ
jgi:hypothetical protein